MLLKSFLGGRSKWAVKTLWRFKSSDVVPAPVERSLKLMGVNQGGSVFINFSDRNAEVNITSVWQDHCEIQFKSVGDESRVTVGENDGSAYIEAATGDQTDRVVLNLTVPEMISIYIEASTLSLATKNKVIQQRTRIK